MRSRPSGSTYSNPHQGFLSCFVCLFAFALGVRFPENLLFLVGLRCRRPCVVGNRSIGFMDLPGSGAGSNRLAALGGSTLAGAGASGATAGLLEFPAGSFFVIWFPGFFLDSALATFEASSIS